ncbi:MAG: 3'-5' exonuclease, partial [Candidatus Woesearchaeota archaeon]
QFPIKNSDHTITKIIKIDYAMSEEEKRLLYVALTRAKKALYISYATTQPSYFIDYKMKKLCVQI